MMSPPIYAASPPATDARPDFLVRLGVLLPATLADIESAYRDRVKQAHPDRGGTVESFHQLQADYEAARQFALARQGRRGWLTASIERYIAQQEIVAAVTRRGGTVETKSTEWLARELGEDFAQVAENIEAISLPGPQVTAADIAYLVENSGSLQQLHRLDLSGARIGNAGIAPLRAFTTLREIDLRGTFVGDGAVLAIAAIKSLRRIRVASTFLTWWGRRRLRGLRPDVEICNACEATHHAAGARRGYRIALALLAAYWFTLMVLVHMPLGPSAMPPLVAGLLSWDKVGHACLYGGLAMLAAVVISMRGHDRRPRTGLSAGALATILIGVSALGALSEFTQPLTNRTQDRMDWVADTTGAAVALAIFAFMHFYWRRSARAPALAATA